MKFHKYQMYKGDYVKLPFQALEKMKSKAMVSTATIPLLCNIHRVEKVMTAGEVDQVYEKENDYSKWLCGTGGEERRAGLRNGAVAVFSS
ncbi:hypothetical protein NEOLI_001389 [Neolecta irregularis DAH-3]|uniref:Uncharacterized protein n=1 Tax=Neolecta irregularis (strain DAH-3) TaxID=1198029 RepID=A0A1U7LTK0_NEOID|nr:hypothetical protein NEOLI_001389 [Neolecta irregularis DAH-3]|eukprot:OLL25872.1 hypothetical protein NEOLI_001389 [Neolecta irregularis DAH-3]